MNGFDGLLNPGECGCVIDDIGPCMCDSVLTCEPGYLWPGDEEYDFYIKKERPDDPDPENP